MTKKSSSATPLTDDVQIIREILFGQHLKNLDDRLVALEKTVAALQQTVQQIHTAVEAVSEARKKDRKSATDKIGRFKRTIHSQLGALEDRLTSQVDSQTQAQQKALHKVNNNLAENFQQMQQEVSAQLHAHRLEQDNLIATLATALTQYKQTLEPFPVGDAPPDNE